MAEVHLDADVGVHGAFRPIADPGAPESGEVRARERRGEVGVGLGVDEAKLVRPVDIAEPVDTTGDRRLPACADHPAFQRDISCILGDRAVDHDLRDLVRCGTQPGANGGHDLGVVVEPNAGVAVRADRGLAEHGAGGGADAGPGSSRVLHGLTLLEQRPVVDDPGDDRDQQSGDDGEFDGGGSAFAPGAPEAVARRHFG